MKLIMRQVGRWLSQGTKRGEGANFLGILSARRAKFRHGNSFLFPTSHKQEEPTKGRPGSRSAAHDGSRRIHGSQPEDCIAETFRRFNCSHRVGEGFASRIKRREAGVRSQRACRSPRHSARGKAAQEDFAGGLYALHHLRAVPHVHKRRAVGRAGPRSLRSDDCRCQPALQPDPDSGCRG